MDFNLELTNQHSKKLTVKIVNHVGADKKKFKALIDIFFGTDQVLAQRAAWPLSYIVIDHPQLITPFMSKCILKLEDASLHPAIHRNLLKILQDVSIPAKYEAKVIDCCFDFIISAHSATAIKAFAITVASKICVKYPELKSELLLHLKHLQNFPMSPAVRVRIRRAIKEIG